MNKITVNANKVVGKIKPMHAVNNGPLGGPGRGKWELMKEAGIPFARLHDTGGAYGGHVYVDIANVFRDFSKDPLDPNNYNFEFTDWLMQSLTENGAEPYYRLGSTIENAHRIKPFNIYPPQDNLKWAKICEGIIRHYTEGWGNGFHYKITYWEIWNEPDNEPEIEDNPMWKGTKEQFFELYQVAASYLKGKFPHLKFGGYASCGFYKIANIAADPTAHISPRIEYFIEFFHDFLKYISDEKHKAPLDFFSWHSYSGVWANQIYTDYARKTLDEYGFTETEHFLNEWNPGIRFRGQTIDATNIASNMLALHTTSVDMLMYYDWRLNIAYNGAVEPLTYTPTKAFYVFKGFNELYRIGSEVESVIEGKDVYCLAAKNDEYFAIMVTNDTDDEKIVKYSVDGVELKNAEVLLIDENNTYERQDIILTKDQIKLSPRAVAVIKTKI